MTSKVEICNLAISNLGIGKEIAILETEKSQEAGACRRFYDIARRATLADLYWNFATDFYTLNLIEEDPTEEWHYSYRYPSGCIVVRRIISAVRNETINDRTPYKVAKDAAGKIIYTDQENAKIEATIDVEDPTFFSDSFVIALSFRLSFYLAPRLTGGDPFRLQEKMLKQYAIELGRATANAMNEEVPDTMPESLSITARS